MRSLLKLKLSVLGRGSTKSVTMSCWCLPLNAKDQFLPIRSQLFRQTCRETRHHPRTGQHRLLVVELLGLELALTDNQSLGTTAVALVAASVAASAVVSAVVQTRHISGAARYRETAAHRPLFMHGGIVNESQRSLEVHGMMVELPDAQGATLPSRKTLGTLDGVRLTGRGPQMKNLGRIELVTSAHSETLGTMVREVEDLVLRKAARPQENLPGNEASALSADD